LLYKYELFQPVPQSKAQFTARVDRYKEQSLSRHYSRYWSEWAD